MIICSKKDLKIMTGVMAASLLLGGCSSPAAPASTTSKTINDDPSVKAEINLKDVGDADYDKDQMKDARTIDTPQIIRGASVNGGIKIIWEEMMGYNVKYHLYRKDESSGWKKIKKR